MNGGSELVRLNRFMRAINCLTRISRVGKKCLLKSIVSTECPQADVSLSNRSSGGINWSHRYQMDIFGKLNDCWFVLRRGKNCVLNTLHMILYGSEILEKWLLTAGFIFRFSRLSSLSERSFQNSCHFFLVVWQNTIFQLSNDVFKLSVGPL